MDMSYITSTNEHTHIMYIYTLTYTIFRDNRETMKELTYKERSEIQEAEEARSVNIMCHHVHVLSVNYF